METWSTLVSDTGPLISLEAIPTGFEWIWSVLDQLILPPTVLKEVARPYEGRDAFLSKTGLRNLVTIQRAKARPRELSRGGWDALDSGEQAAISLALELETPLLIEEAAGRRVARQFGCEVLGTAGLIDRARQEDLLSFAEARGMWKMLLEKNRIPEALYQSLVRVE